MNIPSKWMKNEKNGVEQPVNAALFAKGGWKEISSPMKPSASESVSIDTGEKAVVEVGAAPVAENATKKVKRPKKKE